MHIHQSLEVLHGAHLQFHGGILVTHEDGARVLLEGGHGPHVVDALLYRLVEGEGLVNPCDDDHHLTGQMTQDACQVCLFYHDYVTQYTNTFVSCKIP